MDNTELMTTHIIIKRFIQGKIDPPEEYHYEVKLHPRMTVLDALEHIRINREPGLLYRHSCHHSSCGTCAMVINGKEGLACMKKITDFGTKEIHLAPLRHFRVIGDLLVDFAQKAQDLDKGLDYLKKAENLSKEAPALEAQRFENCIECGACLSACPVMEQNSDFLGPMILAAFHNQNLKNKVPRKDLEDLIYSPSGEILCDRAIECSRVCPTRVSPARHIQDLRNKRSF